MMGASQTQIKGEEKEQQRKNKMVSSFFSHNGQIYIYIYIYLYEEKFFPLFSVAENQEGKM